MSKQQNGFLQISSTGRISKEDFLSSVLITFAGFSIGWFIAVITHLAPLVNVLALPSVIYLCWLPIVCTKRLHDVGKSGWYLVIPGYNLYLLCKSGDTGVNKYGSDPRSEFIS